MTSHWQTMNDESVKASTPKINTDCCLNSYDIFCIYRLLDQSKQEVIMESQSILILVVWCFVCISSSVYASPTGTRSQYISKVRRTAENMENIPSDLTEGLFPRYGKRMSEAASRQLEVLAKQGEESDLEHRLNTVTQMLLKRLTVMDKKDLLSAMGLIKDDSDNDILKRPTPWNKRGKLSKPAGLEGPFLEAQRRMGPEFNPTGW